MISVKIQDIDVNENSLRERGRILDILLYDQTTRKNLLWATDSYVNLGKTYEPHRHIKVSQITGAKGKLIQPRAAKSREEQIRRSKDKGEVFTPLHIVKQMNQAVDKLSPHYPVNEESWRAYVSEIRLEITCGEAPFITTRYNATSNVGSIIDPKKRVGFLDRKLQVINKFVNDEIEWLGLVEVALKASYGYEWQGDNLLIARENVLCTIDDFYRDKFGSNNGLNLEWLEHFAEITSWNLFQMDGLTFTIPMSCRDETISVPGEVSLFGESEATTRIARCQGCTTGDIAMHNGEKVKVMDWNENTIQYFYESIGDGSFR